MVSPGLRTHPEDARHSQTEWKSISALSAWGFCITGSVKYPLFMCSPANSRKLSHVYFMTSGFPCASSNASGSRGAAPLSLEKQSPRKVLVPQWGAEVPSIPPSNSPAGVPALDPGASLLQPLPEFFSLCVRLLSQRDGSFRISGVILQTFLSGHCSYLASVTVLPILTLDCGLSREGSRIRCSR